MIRVQMTRPLEKMNAPVAIFQNINYLTSDELMIEKSIELFSKSYCTKNREELNTTFFKEKLTLLLEQLSNLTADRINNQYLRRLHFTIFGKDSIQDLKKAHAMNGIAGFKGLVLFFVFRKFFLQYCHWIHDTTTHSRDSGDSDYVAADPPSLGWTEREKAEFCGEEIVKKFDSACHSAYEGKTYKLPSSFPSDEYIRLLRCTLVNGWLKNHYQARNNMRVFILVGQLIEGELDFDNRLYTPSGKPCQYLKSRQYLFHYVTEVPKKEVGVGASRSNDGEMDAEGGERQTNNDEEDSVPPAQPLFMNSFSYPGTTVLPYSWSPQAKPMEVQEGTLNDLDFDQALDNLLDECNMMDEQFDSNANQEIGPVSPLNPSCFIGENAWFINVKGDGNFEENLLAPLDVEDQQSGSEIFTSSSNVSLSFAKTNTTFDPSYTFQTSSFVSSNTFSPSYPSWY